MMSIKVKLFRAILFVLLLPVIGVSAQESIVVPIEVVTWSPDGSKIAFAGGEIGCNQEILMSASIYIVDASTNITINELVGNTCSVWGLAWSLDSTEIVSTNGEPHAKIWDVVSGQLIREGSGYPFGIDEVVWSPDSTEIVNSWAESAVVEVWNAQTGETIITFGDQTPQLARNRVNSIDWSPDGQQIVSGGIESYDNPDGFVRIWDAETAELLAEYDHPGGVFSVAWKPDGTQIASGSGNSEIRIWDVETGEVVQTLQGDGGKLRWHPFQNLITGGSGGENSTITVWNTQTGEVVETFETEAWTPSVDWSPYGGRLVYNAQDSITIDSQSRSTNVFGGALQIVVPAPSLEQLNGIAPLCTADVPAPLSDNNVLGAKSVAALQVADLPDFVAQVKALPEGALPAACAADLIAVAEAIE